MKCTSRRNVVCLFTTLSAALCHRVYRVLPYRVVGGEGGENRKNSCGLELVVFRLPGCWFPGRGRLAGLNCGVEERVCSLVYHWKVVEDGTRLLLKIDFMGFLKLFDCEMELN